jgi:hypothetical protein
MGKILQLEVRSGLCNRLRALVSGICLAEDLNCGLMVYWPSSKRESAAAFFDLFENSSLPGRVKVEDKIIVPVKKIFCHYKKDALQAFVNNLVINSNQQFHSTDKERFVRHLRSLQPVKNIKSRVNKNLCSLPPGLTPIGVHIRRTDHQRSIEESPFGGFVKEMRKIQKGYFYLATDDPLVASELMKNFPGRIHCHETLRNRNTVEGVQEAMVSLYTLASCSFILGCGASSFSNCAALIGQKELYPIGNVV